jgi:uncharacterized protein
MSSNMSTPAANPLPLAFICYAVSVFILSGFLWGKLEPQPDVGYALFCGGLGLILAAFATYRMGNTFATTMLAGYGVFWASTAFYLWFFAARSANLNADLGWISVPWAVFTAFMFLASLRTNLPAVQVLLGTLFLVYFFVWLHSAFHFDWALRVAAVWGIISAIDAAFGSYHDVMDSLGPARGVPTTSTRPQPTA